MSEPLDTPQTQPPATPADMPQQQREGKTETDESKLTLSQEFVDEALRKLKQENHSLRTRLKESEPLVKKAQEAEEAGKTEIQKAAERAAKAEQALLDREVGYTRLELAVKYNIPPDDIDLIGSGTREEMDAKAARLAALHAASMKATPPPSDRPVEGLRPGAAPEPPKPADDSYPAAWAPAHLREKESRSQYGQ